MKCEYCNKEIKESDSLSKEECICIECNEEFSEIQRMMIINYGDPDPFP